MHLEAKTIYPILTKRRDYCYREVKISTLDRIYCKYGDPNLNPRNVAAVYKQLDFSEIHANLYALEGKHLQANMIPLWESFARALINAGCFQEEDFKIIVNKCWINIKNDNRRWHVKPLLDLLCDDLTLDII